MELDNESHNKIHLNPADVVKLILQFCKENNFNESLRLLQIESGIKLNTVDSIVKFKDDLIKGRWNLVLKEIDGLEIDVEVLNDLYEQVIFDLIENDDREVARFFLNRMRMRNVIPSLEKLENYINQGGSIKEIYIKENFNKEKRRIELAERISKELIEVPVDRLKSVLTHGIQYECEKMKIQNLEDYDLFKGEKIIKKGYQEQLPSIIIEKQNFSAVKSSSYVRNEYKKLNFDPSSYVQSAKFSYNGKYLATGNVDGLIEIWDPINCELSPDLEYQKESPMWHKESVTAVNFNKDSNMICSGDVVGNIKVYKLANGKCLREFINTHSKGVTCLVYTKDNSHIISGSYDSTIKILGLKAGKIIHEISTHTSFISDIQIDWNGDKFYSASADGSVKCWNVKTYELVACLQPPASNLELAINNIIVYASLPNTLLISNRSNTVYLMNINGEIIKYYTTEKNKYIVYACMSHDNEWLYAVDEENVLYTFSIKDNVIRNFIKINEKDVIGLTHSPTDKLLASYSLDGSLKIFN